MDYIPRGSSVYQIFQARIWNGLPFHSPGDLPDPGIEPTSPVSPALQADSLPLSHLGSSLVKLSKALYSLENDIIF